MLSSSSHRAAILLTGALAFAACAAMASPAAPALATEGQADTSAIDWSAAARADLQFTFDAIKAGHGGAVSGHPSVIGPLALGLQNGLAEAATVRSRQDYLVAMSRFVAGFGDPHVGLNLGLKPAAWTGVVLDYVDGQYRVVWSEPGWATPLPPVGAVAHSCDGAWTGTFLHARVGPLINHAPEYTNSASEMARRVMFDYGLGWTPRQCVFNLTNGGLTTYALPLREAAPAELAAVNKRYQAKAREVGLTPLAPGRFWVGMPNFNGATSGEAYEKLYKDLARLGPAQWIIFDLRGNGGGDSSWGNRALRSVFGQAYANQLNEVPTYAKHMIASDATIQQWKYYAGLKQFAASRAAMEEDIVKLEAAKRAGAVMARVSGSAAGEAEARAQAERLMATVRRRPGGPRMAAVIDRGCFSSCMNFVQQLLAMDDTVLLGEPTLGYSPYGESNTLELPGERGRITIPAAVYASLQATRAPFMPRFRFGGNLADDAVLMQWVDQTLSTVSEK